MRRIARNLISLPDPRGVLADMLSQVRQLRGHMGIDFLKLFHRELIRLRPYAQNRVETTDGRLGDDELVKITNTFSRHLGRAVVLENAPNPSLLGGVRVIIGDRRWERSIRGCLERFV
ncbi:MAG: F0F1 ATP synthase subunit delta [Puniceicoccales bacterium]|nr:F0F1 ATP synthase subunit delta [Puniceicoccales bacterium]